MSTRRPWHPVLNLLISLHTCSQQGSKGSRGRPREKTKWKELSSIIRVVFVLLHAQVHSPKPAWVSTRSDLLALPNAAIRLPHQQVFLDVTWRLFSAALPRTAPQRSQRFSLQTALPRYGIRYLHRCRTAREFVVLAAVPFAKSRR